MDTTYLGVLGGNTVCICVLRGHLSVKCFVATLSVCVCVCVFHKDIMILFHYFVAFVLQKCESEFDINGK